MCVGNRLTVQLANLTEIGQISSELLFLGVTKNVLSMYQFYFQFKMTESISSVNVFLSFVRKLIIQSLNFVENDKTFKFKRHVSTETSVIFS